MPALEKARLMEIDADEAAKPVSGSEIPVQFNPQSLKLSLANVVGKQDTASAKVRQSIGNASTTLSFELQFDTSDEGSTDAPVSVRTRTSAIERFVLAKPGSKQKQRPPKARFIWKDLQIDGIIEDVSIDFDLFAADGTPLRAKMSVTMKEQDARYMRGELGSGANTASGVRPPGMSSAGPGSFGASAGMGIGLSAGIGISGGIGFGAGASIGASFTDSTRLALSGESAAEFAVRAGLDPAAWRGVTAGMDSTLSLRGGAEVDFNASLSSGAGVGVTVGVEAGASASPEAALGLDQRGAIPTPAGVALGGAGASAGFAIAAAGGVGAAIETVKTFKANGAADAAKAAFSTAPGPPRKRPDQSRAPMAVGGIPSAATQAAAPSAPAPPVADVRAVSFGFGVPLRARAGVGGSELRAVAPSGAIPLRPNTAAIAILQPSSDPTEAPWKHLPIDSSRRVADKIQSARRPTRPCGCLGPCTHGSI